jgi:alanine dehydrogenase
MVESMPRGSVIVDISIDQGGCVETIRATDYNHPVYEEAGVLHMGVTNMPGAVPRTASQALSGAILPYALKLASGQGSSDAALRMGVNVRAGQLVHPALQEIFDFRGGSVV